jgi:C-terminal processing protease CtpA/Prc
MRSWTFSLLIAWLLLSSQAQAQWKAVYTDLYPLDTLYSLRSEATVPASGGYLFPEYEFYDQSCTDGYVLVDLSRPDGQTWTRTFRNNLPVRRDTTLLYQRLLVVNAATYTFYLADAATRTYYSRTYRPTYEGYQVPVTEAVSGWTRLPDAATLPPALRNRSGSWLSLTAVAANPAAPCRVVANALVLSDQVNSQFPVRHPFFARLLGQATYPADQPSRYHSTCIERGTQEESTNALHSTIRLSGPSGIRSELDLFRKLMQTALDEYPFYRERYLDRRAVQQTFLALSAAYPDTTTYCAFVQATSDWLSQTFGDGHFRISSLPRSCPRPVADKGMRRPVRLYALNGQVYVMAVLDTAYAQRLPVGSRVITIDNRAAETLLSLQPSRSGYELTTPLDKAPSDSTRFVIANPDGSAQQVVVHHNGTLKVPAQFRPPHADFRILAGNVAYFRINNWFLDVYLRLLNHWSDLGGSRGLIIDLRGNGGGTALSAYRLLSVLVDKPARVYETTSATGPGELLVRPDAFHIYSPHKPVVILCDHKTACSSELFMQAMRTNRPGTRIVGTDDTPGTLAQRVDLWFPSGLVLYTNYISPRIEFGNGISLESKGLQPDEYVRFESLRDLRPFEDKVLRVAAGWIRQKTLSARWSRENSN